MLFYFYTYRNVRHRRQSRCRTPSSQSLGSSIVHSRALESIRVSTVCISLLHSPSIFLNNGIGTTVLAERPILSTNLRSFLTRSPPQFDHFYGNSNRNSIRCFLLPVITRRVEACMLRHFFSPCVWTFDVETIITVTLSPSSSQSDLIQYIIAVITWSLFQIQRFPCTVLTVLFIAYSVRIYYKHGACLFVHNWKKFNGTTDAATNSLFALRSSVTAILAIHYRLVLFLKQPLCTSHSRFIFALLAVSRGFANEAKSASPIVKQQVMGNQN